MRRFEIVAAFAVLTASFACASEPPPSARDALDRAVRFMGGEAAVYAIRTLVVTTDSLRQVDGRTIGVPARTYYAFPLSVRHEIVVNGRTLAMASAPNVGGVLFTEEGPAPLSEAARLGVERTTMRNPVALLKTRLGRAFSAEHIGRETIDGREVDLVRIAQHDNATLLSIDRSEGRLVEIRYELKDRSGPPRTISVRFGDWRATAGGLVYPYSARGREDGRDVFEVTTRDVEVDVPLTESLFTGGMGTAGVAVPMVR